MNTIIQSCKSSVIAKNVRSIQLQAVENQREISLIKHKAYNYKYSTSASQSYISMSDSTEIFTHRTNMEFAHQRQDAPISKGHR